MIVAPLLAALLHPALAQAPDATVIRATARLKQLSVVVVDRNGHPVEGLTKDDFQVLDNGREEEIAHFLAIPVSPAEHPSNVSPLTVTNRPHDQGKTAAALTVILVDELFDGPGFATSPLRLATESARLQVLEFFTTVQPGGQVALYDLRPGKLMVVHDFTDDQVALAAAARAWFAAPWQRESATWTQTHAVMAGNAFQSIARYLGGIPGRKNVVWISLVFPKLGPDLPNDFVLAATGAIPSAISAKPGAAQDGNDGNYDRLRGFARWLSDADVAVYPIEARGLMGPLELTGGDARRRNSPGAAPRRAPSAIPYENQRGGMDFLAAETGGRAFYETNGLSEHIGEVLREARSAYVLDYYLDENAWDGTYHSIDVRMKRDGLIARCRRGYLAADDSSRYDSESALRDAAGSPLEASAVGLTLGVSSNPMQALRQDVSVTVDTQDVRFGLKDGLWRADVNLVFAQLGKDGRTVDGVKDRVEPALSPGDYREAAAHGWVYRKSLDIKPEAEKLRVVVQDIASGAMGSVSVPVSQPRSK
jgi:VWFA-related protein